MKRSLVIFLYCVFISYGICADYNIFAIDDNNSTLICNDGIMYGDDEGIGCSSSIYNASPSCDDNQQNGDEIGVDCGGIDCPECPPCVDFDFNDVETEWGIWNLGGVGSRFNDANYANSGEYSFKVINGSSNIHSDLIDFSNHNAFQIDFNFITTGFFGSQGFELQISTDGGTFFSTIETYSFNADFINDDRVFEILVVENVFTEDLVIRFIIQFGGGGRALYIDDLNLEICEFPCTHVNLSNAEYGWGIWNDGGEDAIRVEDAELANSGDYSFLLKDNTSTSVITSEILDGSNYNTLEVDFNFITIGFDNDGEDFWLQISTDGGLTFETVEEWNLNDEFENNIRVFDNLVIVGDYSDETVFRFKCDASGNNDKLYLDDLDITFCNSFCDDGIKNGDEQGIDCGGTNCTPCDPCLEFTLNDWENGWEDWTSGGEDAIISSNPIYANSGSHSLLLKDNSSSSKATTISYDLANNDQLDLSFNFISDGFNNNSEDFWFQISLDGGTSFTTLEDWVYLDDFENGERIFIDLSILGPFSNDTKFRFVCDASGNNDKLFIDDIEFTCAFTSSCSDGIQNGDEEDIDCGGANCDPCTEPCSELDFNDAETGWGLWNDGGADAARANNVNFANSGTYSFLIKDNTSTSVITTDTMDLSSYDSLIIEFSFIAEGFNNNTQDFWLQVSTDGGISFSTVWDWAYSDDFENGVREFENITIAGAFSSETMIRFRCDATGNNDKIYIDDILITACDDNGLIEPILSDSREANDHVVTIHPNPISLGGQLNVQFDRKKNFSQLSLINVSGRVVFKYSINSDSGEFVLETNHLEEGMYILQLKSTNQIVSKRVIVLQ